MKLAPALLVCALLPFAQAQDVPKSAAEAKKMDRTGKYKAGDPAPDFNLKLMHSEKRLALSSFQGKRPVALVFGSYT